MTGMSYSHGNADVTIHHTDRLIEVMSERIRTNGDLSYLHGHTSLAAARLCWNRAADHRV